MNGERKLSGTACAFLIILGLFIDATKIGLDLLFGAGLILDPLFITPIATAIFWITLNHNGIPMFTGRRSWAGWSNLVFSLVPGIDGLPDWTAYAIYLTVTYR